MHTAFRYSARVVNKILSLATCRSSPERMQSRCPHSGAERVSSPKNLLGVLTQVRVDQYLNPVGTIRTSGFYPVVSSIMLYYGTSVQSISFSFSNFFSVSFLNEEFGRWALHEDDSMVFVMKCKRRR